MLNMLKYQHLSKIISKNILCYFSIAKQIQQMHKKNPSSQYNVTQNILKMTDRKLLSIESHPLSIITQKIINFYGPSYNVETNISPIVTVQNNFDVLNIPSDHVSRKSTDTFYINQQYVLRTHTSAHQKNQLQKGLNSFLVFGDVYRRDQIDKFHYPAFHQMEAVRMLGTKDKISIEETQKNLKTNLQQLAKSLFNNCQMRWVDAYFPFTHPSYELELFFQGKWVEMLGCGIIHQSVLDNAGRSNERGWAAGLGLQRFAMRLFNIPDVRLFWSEDKRFSSQFTKGVITEFKSFSKYPQCIKDLSMWITPQYNSNDLYSIIREIGGDLIEFVNESDTYFDKNSNRVSKTYRINFRSFERTLTNQEITDYQFLIRKTIASRLKTVQLRGKIQK